MEYVYVLSSRNLKTHACFVPVNLIAINSCDFRATAFGFLSCLGRVAAILGNATFGNLIDVNKAFPVLITSAVLFAGGAIGLKLPESKSKTM